MKRLGVIWWISMCYWLLTMSACSTSLSKKEIEYIDMLNQEAYYYRYRNLDTLKWKAASAYELSKGRYLQGEIDALSNRAFYDFMCMDFESARQRYLQMHKLTKNELDLLIADVGMMKICQRLAQNKEFYDFRNKALIHLQRIAEEDYLLNDESKRQKLNYVRSEFYIVSAIYHYYLQQHNEAKKALNNIEITLLEGDIQWLYLHYIKGSASLSEDDDIDKERLNNFDELYTVWKKAKLQGYTYFEANALQGLANLMISDIEFDFYKGRRSYALEQIGIDVDDLFSLRLGQIALEKFKCYDDGYQIAGAYVSISKYLNYHQYYEEALDSLQLALQWVNEGENVIPECLSRIYEQLSVTYAGLGLKTESDNNRNVYLDLLEYTRQDKELESRFQALQQESKSLNIIFHFVVVAIFIAILLCFKLIQWARKHNNKHVHRLHLLLDICQKITSSIPHDAQNKEVVLQSIEKAIKDDLNTLFNMDGISILDEKLCFPEPIDKERKAMADIINPYIQWALHNGMVSISLEEERLRLNKQLYVEQQHLISNKRQNLIKKACFSIVYGIQPYIDRLSNEIKKITKQEYIYNDVIKTEKIQYMDELVNNINEYNEILASWIQLRQGALSLLVENFALEDLFSLIRKGNRSFEMKQISLEVQQTASWVKADKALTLFMINTLTENARKFTQSGGCVKVYAQQHEEFVEISIADNGSGLSEKDVNRIIGEKVYDSKKIGIYDTSNKGQLRKNKGNGYGLMNCKGIIEKYRKTNDLFKVCLFQVESKLGEGSRFYFRLPKGIKKTLIIIPIICTLVSCIHNQEVDSLSSTNIYSVSNSLQNNDTLEYEILLDRASDFANEVYYCNVNGDYEQALLYADSAISCLNEHYEKFSSIQGKYISLIGKKYAAELEWWNSAFDSDFHVILDIRNEAAVAFLALKEWDAYAYNNMIYTTLYKLLGEDNSLEYYCRRLEQTSSHKNVGIALAIILFLFSLFGFCLFYYRRFILHRWRLEQILTIQKQVYEVAFSPSYKSDDIIDDNEAQLMDIPSCIVERIFETVNELLGINSLTLAICNETKQRLEFTSYPKIQEDKSSIIHLLINRSFEEQNYLSNEEIQVFPLSLSGDLGHRCIGAIALERRVNELSEHDKLLIELMGRFVAIILNNAVIKISNKYEEIDIIQNDVRRIAWESSQIHVQNMVLDNCLSTLKHETIYYPSKIKLLLSKLSNSHSLLLKEEKLIVNDITELIDFYREVFMLLSQCGARQIENMTFRRSHIAIDNCIAYAEKFFYKLQKNRHVRITLSITMNLKRVTLLGDEVQLKYLLELILSEALSFEKEGKLALHVTDDNDFVNFKFFDYRRSKNSDELRNLFNPSKNMMKGNDVLHSTEYLICKQIIREHDEYGGKRGCRIYAEPLSDREGFVLCFSLPH